MKNTVPRTGRHFLQIPGPTNVPDRILHAISMPVIDHRGPEFAMLGQEVVSGMKRVFKTDGLVVIYPSSGTGAWEAALSNTLSPGDKVLMFETGQFAALWHKMAVRLGLEVEMVTSDWRHAVDPAFLEQKLSADTGHAIKAVCVVHNETSSGITNNVEDIRTAIDRAQHPALLMVDTISSLGSIDYRHDEWKVDVTIGGSQKGLMLPPGLGFNAVSKKALQASATARLPRAYFDWEPMLDVGRTGWFPFTPATNLLFGLREALTMLLEEEGLDHVFRRHARHAEATRRAVAAWGLENVCADPQARSNTVTAIMTPAGFDADRLRQIILEAFDLSLGTGLGKLQGRVFRIGHLGHFNDLMLSGTLAGVEMGLHRAGIPHQKGGIMAALDYLGSPLSDLPLPPQ